MFKHHDSAILRSTGESVTFLRYEGTHCVCRDGIGNEVRVAEHDLQMTWAPPKTQAAPVAPPRPAGRLPYGDPRGDALESLIRGFPYDFNGHWKDGERDAGGTANKNLVHYVFERGFLATHTIPEADVDAVLAAAAQGQALERWVDLGGGLVTSNAACSYCGSARMHVETDGRTLRIVGACPKPEGLPKNEWELNVPSGRIVVGNDLRSLFPTKRGKARDINHLLNQRATAHDYADVGLSHAFVGASWVAVSARKRAGTYEVSRTSSKSRLVRLSLGLWWYSICDADEFERRCHKYGLSVAGTLEDLDCTVIDIPKGVYRFSHDEEANRKPGKKVHSTFRRVRDADPVRDFLGEDAAVHVTAGQYAQHLAANHHAGPRTWATMNAADKNRAWWYAAVGTLLHGNADAWHENGFPRVLLEEPYEDVPVPKRLFRRQESWPQVSTFTPLVVAAGLSREARIPLSPSFARLAFEVLASMISFGITPRDGIARREVGEARETMYLALRCYRALVLHYADHADPKYVAWVRDGDRAEQWIAAFDLGPRLTERHLASLEAQRVLPDGTAFVEIDARTLDPRRLMHGQNGHRLPYRVHEPGWVLGGEDDGWFGTSSDHIPLYAVARVVATGTRAHTGERLVEVLFDYGTPAMLDPNIRKGIEESPHKATLRPLSEAEYLTRLPEAVKAYEEAAV